MVSLYIPEDVENPSITNKNNNTFVPNESSMPSNTKIFIPDYVKDDDSESNAVLNKAEGKVMDSPEASDDTLSKQQDISADIISKLDVIAARDEKKYFETYVTSQNIQDVSQAQKEYGNKEAAIKRRSEMMKERGISEIEANKLILQQADEGSPLYNLASGVSEEDIAIDAIAYSMPNYEKQKAKIIERLQSKNSITSGLTDWLLEEASKPNGMTLAAINTLVTSDQFLNPVTSLVDVPILFAEAQEEFGEGNYGMATVNFVLSGLSAIPAIGVIGLGKKGISSVAKKTKIKNATLGKYSVAQEAKINETKIALKAKADAAREASKYSEIEVKLIDEFEEVNDVIISKVINGKKVVDYEKVRASGVEISKKVYDDGFLKSFKEDIAGRADLDLADLVNSSGDLVSPILNPEKFNGLIAVVGKLKERVPDAFDNKKKVIDNLFDFTLKGDVKQTDALVNDLAKYGLSFEDYILAISGSASQAGKILNKVSQMKRQKSLTLKNVAKENRKMSSEEGIKKFWSSYVLRGENIRRGLMVSALATAARNATSYGIRAPAETLVNIFEEAAWKFAQQNAKGSTMKGVFDAGQTINPFAKTGTYTDAFAEMKYIFAKPKEARETVEYILDRPEMRDLNDTLFGNIGELQKLRGRGQANNPVSKAADAIYSTAEDISWLINTPNRFQEFTIRRGVFMGNLERAVKKEYGADLNQLLKDGKIRDLLNDATTVRPEGSRSFYSLLDDASQRALDVTYAKQPDFWAFRRTSDFITKSGLTVVLPFPRFMFNAMELMARYSGGAALPLIKKINGSQLDTRADFRAVGENIVGASAFMAALQYRKSDDAPPKYQELRADDGSVVDVSAQFPMRQFMYLAEAYRQWDSGNWENFDPDLKEMSETFLGTQFRAGTTNVFLKDVRETLMGVGGAAEEDRAKRIMGRFIGQYVNTFFTPIFQVTETQRAMGVRPDEYKDFKPEPSLEGGFREEFMRSINQRGLVAPSKEKELTDREFLFNKDAKRIGIMGRLITGIGLKEADSPDGDYLTSIGKKDYLIGSKSDSPTVRNFENAIFRAYIPMVTQLAKIKEQQMLDVYDSQPDAFKDKYDKIEAGVDAAQLSVEKSMEMIRNSIQSGAIGKATPLVRKIMDYRKLDRTQRTEGGKLFLRKHGREPMLTNITDIIRLIKYGKAVK